jgi:hypothetical protein
MRLVQPLITIGVLAVAALAAGQDDRLPVIRPQLEVLKASPAPFPLPNKTAADYDTWIRTPWIHMNPAKCDRSCANITITTIAGGVQIDNASARKGPAKMRLGVTIPASCGEYAWYGEMRDQVSSGAGITDPAEQPIELSRIHLFRFDERGREISMVFQNDHTERSRQARLNVLCKTKS